jgi:hypothetical protein
MSFSMLWRTSLTFFPSLLVNREAQHRAAIYHNCRVTIDSLNRTSSSSPPSTLS